MNRQPRHEAIVRYRLTFDANPKELARRESMGSHVVLLWSRRKRRTAVVVEDDATGALVELEVGERENPLELFEHPYVYIPTRGEPGRRSADHPEEVSAMKKLHDKRDIRDIRKDSKRDP